MAINPYRSFGLWRAWESARESAIPIMVATAAWVQVSPLLKAPSSGRPFSEFELAMLLGGLAALTSWAISRQWTVFGRLRPLPPMIWGTAAALGAVALSATLSKAGFSSWCAETAGGVLQPLTDAKGEVETWVCQRGSVPGNPYLKGTMLHPNWDGALAWTTWTFATVCAMLAAVGFRDLRIWRTGVGDKLHQLLKLAPGGGSAVVAGGDKPENAAVVACRNGTLWGELCGQMYAVQREFEPGEWCVRCQQPFRPAERTIQVTIVSLAIAEIDVLNGLERLDMLSWARGQRPPPDPRLSGEERWVVLGEARLPDVLTVAQALGLAMEVVEGASGSTDERVAAAAKLATSRGSRVACWFWPGRPLARLTYARPTDRAVLGIGPERLRDLLPESGGRVVLQVDIGLMPIELRTGFCKRFLDPSRADELRNSKQDIWVPVGPFEAIKESPGAWVPRLEGEALRAWLSLDRMQPADVRGVTVPLSYRLPEALRDPDAPPPPD
ncbi:MAG TPA: hypothetical protein DFR83_22670, partial [Deltaproteobacteria bacterium]|nr:hypothetical protein [Deltaproteobacteria bacterium]